MAIDQAEPETGFDQLRQACTELQRRLSAGEPCRAEEFLSKYPVLAKHDDLAVQLALTEFVVRRSLGEQPTPDEWYSRFPQWREALQQQFQVGDAFSEQRSSSVVTVPEPTPSATDEAKPAAQTFAHYQLLEELGHGGMGIVFRAWDNVLKREVALKRLRPGALDSTEHVERFYREARAAARLAHRHIVPVLELGESEGQHYFTMPLVPGGSLAENLKPFTEDPRKAVALLAKVARAVQAAHEQDIVHRDLKPGNILLDAEGEPLVSDFGLAKFLDTSGDLTQTGQVVGTPAYMAPELVSGHGNTATAQTDIWSLGVILYLLLTGQRPFSGSTVGELSPQILQQEPPRPRKLRPPLDRDLETIVLKCLEKDPARRYASAGAFADDLQNWLDGKPILARPDGWLRWGWRKARRHPFWCAAVLLLALVPTTFYLVSFKDPERKRRAIELALAQGREQRLIGNRGAPEWYRLCAGTGLIMDQPAEVNPHATVAAIDYCLVELVADPQVSHYRLTAEVQHGQETEENADVGIYFAYGEYATREGIDRCWATLSFNDQRAWFLPDPNKKEQWSLAQLMLWREHGPKDYCRCRLADSPPFHPAGEIKPLEPRWRQLTVEMTSDGVECFWEKERFAQLTWVSMRDSFEQQLRRSAFRPGDSPELQPVFAPRQGLGLWAQHGRSYYRNVTITPLE